MARKKINPRRQELVEWIESNGECVEDESLRELEVLADIMGMNDTVDEIDNPVRKRERPWARFSVCDPELITMFQGSGECELSSTHAIRKHAREISENAPVYKCAGLTHALKTKSPHGRGAK